MVKTCIGEHTGMKMILVIPDRTPEEQKIRDEEEVAGLIALHRSIERKKAEKNTNDKAF